MDPVFSAQAIYAGAQNILLGQLCSVRGAEIAPVVQQLQQLAFPKCVSYWDISQLGLLASL